MWGLFFFCRTKTKHFLHAYRLFGMRYEFGLTYVLVRLKLFSRIQGGGDCAVVQIIQLSANRNALSE